jgi:S-DNA-T family DNA segregation ATPase FtsK/SpoIIIE
MAAKYPPARVNFLLVDFKGGSAFAALARVPHVVGTITDLDETGAARALQSLRAELRYRERVLVSAAARSIDDISDLPRLVIAVDEFAAMMSQFPDLHALFADVAARGRSLGVHLILCTQRPAGVVRDAVLANTDLRISLRVNNRADSIAVVGSDAAAEIPADARGRGVVQLAGDAGQLVQFAIASARDSNTVVDRWSGETPQRRPWCEPLENELSPSILDDIDGGFAFGVTDLPHEQRRGVAAWNPAVDGHLLILGAPSSGKSTALAAIARNRALITWIPTNPDAAWDVVCSLLDELETPREGGEVLVMCDDLDVLVSRLSPDYRSGFVERLARVLREGGARGIRVAIAAQRATPELQPLLGLVVARLMLRHASRNDFVIAGGDGASFIDQLPPGGGLWHGARVQVVAAQSPGHIDPEPSASFVSSGSTLAIVSTRLGALRKVLDLWPDLFILDVTDAALDLREVATSRQLRRVVIIGDVDDWQSRWGAINAVRPVAEILFDGCTPADFRVVTRSRELPPPMSAASALGTSSLFWRLEQDGSATRVRLPLPPR